MGYLYHGSIVPNITFLKSVSKLHNGLPDEVVYLTANRAYALFYIWDADHNKRTNKWITYSIKNGICIYYEQFPDQLRAFYDGVKGYLYSVRNKSFEKTDEEDMYVNKSTVSMDKCEIIDNVYEEILRIESAGNLKIVRYKSLSAEEQNRIVDMIVGYIEKKQLLLSPMSEEAVFISTYYREAWEKAKKL